MIMHGQPKGHLFRRIVCLHSWAWLPVVTYLMLHNNLLPEDKQVSVTPGTAGNYEQWLGAKSLHIGTQFCLNNIGRRLVLDLEAPNPF